MKHYGFNAVIFTLMLTAILGMVYRYNELVVDPATAPVSAEAAELLIMYAPQCNNVDLLKAYATDGKITIDEGHSLLAICEVTAWENATPRERAQREIETGLSM